MTTGAGAAKPSNWNVPNILTGLRLVMVPLFGWVLLAFPTDPVMRWLSTAIFVIAIATDAVPWTTLRESAGAKAMRLASAKPGAPITGFLSPETADALLKKAGQDGGAAREAAKSPDYKGAALPVTVDLAAQSAIRARDKS